MSKPKSFVSIITESKVGQQAAEQLQKLVPEGRVQAIYTAYNQSKEIFKGALTGETKTAWVQHAAPTSSHELSNLLDAVANWQDSNKKAAAKALTSGKPIAKPTKAEQALNKAFAELQAAHPAEELGFWSFVKVEFPDPNLIITEDPSLRDE